MKDDNFSSDLLNPDSLGQVDSNETFPKIAMTSKQGNASTASSVRDNKGRKTTTSFLKQNSKEK